MNASLSRIFVVWGALVMATSIGVNSWAQEEVLTVPGDYPDEEATTDLDGTSEPVIAIDSLDSIDIESIGTQDNMESGFGNNLWDGITRTDLETLLILLPTSVQSAAGHNLMKRLLVSSAPVPPKTQDSKNLLELRLQKLADLGEFQNFTDLLDAIPTHSRTEAMKKLQGEVLFLQRDTESACAMATQEVQEASNLFWQKALCICQAVDGNMVEALFSLDLLRELLGTDDADFMQLTEVLLGHIPSTTVILKPSALNLILLIENDMAVPEEWVSGAGPAIQKSMALADSMPLMTRLVAGERATLMGALNPHDLAKIYQKIVFEKNEFENVSEVVSEKGGPWGRALLHQATRKKQLPLRRAELLVESWNNSLKASNSVMVAETNMEAWLSLPVHQEIMFAAPSIIRALIAITSSGRFNNITLDDGHTADEEDYNQLLNNPETALEGLKGLLVQAMRRGDKTSALKTVLSALELDPHNPWLLKHLTTIKLQLWLELLIDSAETDEEYDLWLTSLRPILTIADIDPSMTWQPIMADRWWNTLPAEIDPGKRLTQANDLFIVLHALKHSIGTSGWGLLREGPAIESEKVPNVGVRFGMGDAARSERVGHTLLFVLIALGEGGISNAGPVALGSVLRSLNHVAFNQEARILALESLLNNGL